LEAAAALKNLKFRYRSKKMGGRTEKEVNKIPAKAYPGNYKKNLMMKAT